MRDETGVPVKLLQDEMIISRVLADLGDTNRGNTLVIVGGTHGNEVMGLAAIQRVVEYLKLHQIELNGRLIALTGNMEACRLGQRYLHKDLNRLWTRENIDDLHYGRLDVKHTENYELSVVYEELKRAIEECKHEFILVDLHTTSSPTIPFLVTNYMPKAVDFVKDLPLPVIGGLSGFLDGTLLSYINELGHIGMAYEAGQHMSPAALESHESFIWLVLRQSGLIGEDHHDVANYHYQSISKSSEAVRGNYKIISRYRIRRNEEFAMNPGYSNFQAISVGEVLAHNQEGEIKSPYDGFIFMPLYQSKGNDGFFIITKME